MNLHNGTFFKAFNGLLSLALSQKVPYEDTEDIVQEVLIKAIDLFDPNRGSFQGFCQTILNNRIKNYWRDTGRRANTGDDPDQLPGSEEDGATKMEREEAMKNIQRILGNLIGKLDEIEYKFYQEYLNILAETETTLVAKVAKRLNITLQEGHNIFRRIQRKAGEYEDELFRLELLTQPKTEIRISRPLPSVLHEMNYLTDMRLPEELKISYRRIPIQDAEPLIMDTVEIDLRIRSQRASHFFANLSDDQRSKLLLYLS